jgi:hypothetical protein
MLHLGPDRPTRATDNLRNLYRPPSVVREIVSTKLRWVTYATDTAQKKSTDLVVLVYYMYNSCVIGDTAMQRTSYSFPALTIAVN